jgi:hypothetical protein
MNCSVQDRTFRMIGAKHHASFTTYPEAVPAAASAFLGRLAEIPEHAGTEVTVYEPKRGPDHEIGIFYVGMLVEGAPSAVPEDMHYLEFTRRSPPGTSCGDCR